MRVLPALLLVCAVSACNRPAADAASAAAADQAPAANAATAAGEPAIDTANCAFCAEPAFVRTCDVAGGARTTLYWNVADANVAKVGIYVVDDAGKDSPFSDQPSKGSVQTGPWLKPGLTFKLKAPDGKVLQTLVIKGQDC